ncbi:hypothetical protein FHG87_014042 [Trinorchestia longiramus]|nr:hypothetical protein FHG87_014042 [Trinorchestia longiramus]
MELLWGVGEDYTVTISSVIHRHLASRLQKKRQSAPGGTTTSLPENRDVDMARGGHCQPYIFDDTLSREERKKKDKLAPIREISEMFVTACHSNYTSGPDCAVDESLLSFGGSGGAAPSTNMADCLDGSSSSSACVTSSYRHLFFVNRDCTGRPHTPGGPALSFFFITAFISASFFISTFSSQFSSQLSSQFFRLSFLFHLSSYSSQLSSSHSYQFFITASIVALISVFISAFTALSAHCFHLIVALLNPILDHIPDHIPDHISDHILDPIFDHILDHYF